MGNYWGNLMIILVTGVLVSFGITVSSQVNTYEYSYPDCSSAYAPDVNSERASSKKLQRRSVSTPNHSLSEIGGRL